MCLIIKHAAENAFTDQFDGDSTSVRYCRDCGKDGLGHTFVPAFSATYRKQDFCPWVIIAQFPPIERRRLLAGIKTEDRNLHDWIDAHGHLHPARGKLVDVPYLKHLPGKEHSLARALQDGGDHQRLRRDRRGIRHRKPRPRREPKYRRIARAYKGF